MKKALCIMGPTASGKSALALALARNIPAEIISVDSALVYREMDIGTAKPSPAERQEIAHYLIDIINPNEVFSVADFVSQAKILIADIQARQKLPILVGGTMMYFNALQQGLTTLPKAVPVVRENLLQRIAADGLSNLYDELLKHDAIAAHKISPNDKQRIIRALEIFITTGKPLSLWHAESLQQANAQFINICIMPSDRQKLHEKINTRFIEMLENGLVTEVETIYNKWHLTKQHSAMRTVGYRQVLEYILGIGDYNDMIARGQAATRQLAKRQLTWCRSWPKIDLVLDEVFKNIYKLGKIIQLCHSKEI